MLSQGQFFDSSAYEVPTPAAPQPFESGLDTARRFFQTGSSGATGLEDRNARMMANRVRVNIGGATARIADKSKSFADLNIPIPRHEGFYDYEPQWLPATFREHEWRKFGTIEEVPYNRIASAQGGVSPKRLGELHRLPGSGQDPRYSGSMRELPHAVRIDMSDGPAWVLHQGNHRTAADMTGPQPQLLHTMRTITAPDNVGDFVTRSEDVSDYRLQRAARVNHAKSKILSRGVPQSAMRIIEEARRLRREQ